MRPAWPHISHLHQNPPLQASVSPSARTVGMTGENHTGPGLAVRTDPLTPVIGEGRVAHWVPSRTPMLPAPVQSQPHRAPPSLLFAQHLPPLTHSVNPLSEGPTPQRHPEHELGAGFGCDPTALQEKRRAPGLPGPEGPKCCCWLCPDLGAETAWALPAQELLVGTAVTRGPSPAFRSCLGSVSPPVSSMRGQWGQGSSLDPKASGRWVGIGG